jgi:hypothetical protein
MPDTVGITCIGIVFCRKFETWLMLRKNLLVLRNFATQGWKNCGFAGATDAKTYPHGVIIVHMICPNTVIIFHDWWLLLALILVAL